MRHFLLRKSCIFQLFWTSFGLGHHIKKFFWTVVGLGMSFENQDWIWIAKYDSLFISGKGR